MWIMLPCMSFACRLDALIRGDELFFISCFTPDQVASIEG
jgi:hypothetical protein